MSKFEILCPCEGEIKGIEEFPDEVIADKVLGDGFCVNLTGNQIVAPFDGEITVLYPSGHAICISQEQGVQMMIHIGAETYKLEGLNKTFVNVGDHVKKGDLLIKTDVRKMKKKTGNTAAALVFMENERVTWQKKDCGVKCLELVAEVEKDD